LSVCVVIHIAGMASLMEWLVRRRDKAKVESNGFKNGLVLAAVFTLIIALHVAEATIWATFFYARSLFDDFETSLYFSLKTFTTVGYGDVLLPHRWRLLGGVEALCGILLCGLSAAFVFAIVNALFKIRVRQRPQK
jgi:voltage-gated potassium channel Kch